MPIEDEITSCIFGPLRFMTHDMAWRCLRVLFGYPEQLKNIKPTRVDVEFWPRWCPADDGKSVEPDVYITARRDNDIIATIIVEVKRPKWNPSINRDDLCKQLCRQWESPDFCRKNRSLHVFLGHDLLDEDKSAIQKLHRHMHIVSWRGLAKSLKEFEMTDGMLDVWCKDMLKFLAVFDMNFDGFNVSLLATVGKIGWQFQNQWEPRLQAIAQLDWSFNQ